MWMWTRGGGLLLEILDDTRPLPLSTTHKQIEYIRRRPQSKKEDHKGCFQGTLFVQGTTKTFSIKGARDCGHQDGTGKMYGR